MNPTAFNELCLEELKLCGVNESETIAVLTRGDERTAYADSFMWAAQRLGAQTYHLRLPAPSDPAGAWQVGDVGLGSNPLAVDALKKADMVVDCALMLFSPEQFEIQGAGTRVLSAIEPVPVLARLFPTQELRDRVELSQKYLAEAKSLRITNDLGTDVTYRLGKYPAMAEYGYTDTPGRWDHWGCGFAFTGAYDDGVDGTIVLSRVTSSIPSTPTCSRRSSSRSRKASSWTSEGSTGIPASIPTSSRHTSTVSPIRAASA